MTSSMSLISTAQVSKSLPSQEIKVGESKRNDPLLQQNPMIKLHLNDNLKLDIYDLINHIYIWSGKLLDPSRKIDYPLSLPNKASLTYEEWQKEYGILCDICSETAANHPENKKLKAFRDHLTTKQQQTIESYKTALEEVGPILELTTEMKNNIVKLSDKMLSSTDDKSPIGPDKPLSQAFARLNEEIQRNTSPWPEKNFDEHCGLTESEFEELKILGLLRRKSTFAKTLAEEEKQAIEEYKLAIIKKLRKFLENKYSSVKPSDSSQSQLGTIGLTKRLEEISSQRSLLEANAALQGSLDAMTQNQIDSYIKQENELKEMLSIAYDDSQQKMSWYSWPAYWGLMFLDFGPPIMLSMIYAKSSLEFLPFTPPDYLAYPLGIFLSLTELLMAYAFTAPILKQRLGITDNSRRNLPFLYDEQLTSVNRINELLSNAYLVNTMSHNEYQTYSMVASLLNNDMVDTRRYYIDYVESCPLKCLRYVMTVINLAHQLASVIFNAKFFLSMIAPSMALLSPLGIGILAFSLLTILVPRYIYRSSSLFVFMNPKAEQDKNVKTKLDCFRNIKDEEFQSVLKKKETDSAQQETILMQAEEIQHLKASASGFFSASTALKVTRQPAQVISLQMAS